MDLIIYSTIQDSTEKKILRLTQYRNRCILICRSIDDFSRKLLILPREALAVLVIARGMEDLAALLPLSELVQRFRLILLLPEPENIITTQVHDLRPRFIASCLSDFEAIPAVLDKMSNRQNSMMAN